MAVFILRVIYYILQAVWSEISHWVSSNSDRGPERAT